ncbi:magnesium/cobalt transporter CorA [bacterium]|nr:magnesium/cobalt transporter CorA [bacterium]
MSLTPRRRIPLHQSHARVGASPGTLNSPDGAGPTSVSAMAWGPGELVEHDDIDVAGLAELRAAHPVVWVTINGLGDLDRLVRLGDALGFHKLALEDMLNVGQRPKLDHYEVHLYGVARVPHQGEVLQTQQVSLFVDDGLLVTVFEKDSDVLDGVRERARNGRPLIRNSGVDYLLYAVTDAVVDSYFPLLERFGQSLFDMETGVLDNPRKQHIGKLYELKRDLVTLRRYAVPLRDVVEGLMKPDLDLLKPQTRTFMKDCVDHARHAADVVENQAGHVDSLIDLYMNLVNLRMNEVMKVLTVISTLFIPLSFIAGLYGMNFDPAISAWNMPELGWKFGYPYALGLMVLCSAGLVAWFYRKGWFR